MSSLVRRILISSVTKYGNFNMLCSVQSDSSSELISFFSTTNYISSSSSSSLGVLSSVLISRRGYASIAQAIVSSSDSEDEEKKKKTKMASMLRKRQLKMETEAWEAAASDYREHINKMCKMKLAPNLPYVKSLLLAWFNPFREAIVADQKTCKAYNYAPYINQLPADKIATITMHKLIGLMMVDHGNTLGVGSVKVAFASAIIGEAIEDEVRVQKFLENSKKRKEKTKKNTTDDNGGECELNLLEAAQIDQLRHKVLQLIKKRKVRKVKKIVKQSDDSKPWGPAGHVKIGCRLIKLLLETAYIQPPLDQLSDSPLETRPAFVHSVKVDPKTLMRYGVIECDPLLRRGIDKTARHLVITYMPMLVPPKSWTCYDKGAYLCLPARVLRINNDLKRQSAEIKKIPTKQLEPVFEALNALGSTKWKVNRRVLSVVEKIWSEGGALAGLVNHEDVSLPEKPDTEDESEIRRWTWKHKATKWENRQRHSQCCDIELKLAVAKKMKDEEGFYYPHNIDFRGRAYPMHPHLNHLGSDLCRGILEFSEGRPLGKSGLRWLKIHLANVYGGGVDKLSFDSRVAFAENHLDDIFDSANSPLEGQRWWLEAQDPFQCLATCIDLAEALRSPSPESTLSHIPVHQDGSCNGLQHYAALGRDKVGAAAVNLVAGEIPADAYSAIASRVRDLVRKDANDDPSINPHTLHARSLINQVDRKLVKQTVMTSVYGVTYIGARDQIKRRLKERGVDAEDDEFFAAAGYAAKITLRALQDMFESAKNIMSWLGNCAKVIAHDNQAVRWTTPIGLPVLQPYMQSENYIVYTSLQHVMLCRETDKVMVRRQKTAFAPNFIHSIDASHMMMTAVACKKAGLIFAGVHDSYWTHACDVDEMNRILRQKFVELHEKPLLENLLQSFEESFPNLVFSRLPERGNLDLMDVLKSPYFFS